MDRTGKCLCGSVKFVARGVGDASACHCGMCLRWAGGPWIGVFAKSVDWEDRSTLSTIQSSEWAERGFCSKCGSGLFYRITAEGKAHGVTSVSLGSLDDRSGLVMSKEWFIDQKPEAYEFAGERETITEAQAFAMFSGANQV